jgi:hypothetical protein
MEFDTAKVIKGMIGCVCFDLVLPPFCEILTVSSVLGIAT